MRQVSSPNVKICSTFTVQIMDGNLIDTIRKNIASIGHFTWAMFRDGTSPERAKSTTPTYSAPFGDRLPTSWPRIVPSKDPMTTLTAVRAMAAG
jgi:hypothetical protein